jgi:hypothetical protein
LVQFGLLVSGLVSACSASSASYTSDADRGSTHAVVTIERRDVIGETTVQAEAFASFFRTPPEVDFALVTRITGLELRLPELGECQPVSQARDSSVPLSPLRRVELLSAGDVTLETPGGRVDLAPRAFPAVTDVVAGVVYTTRDRAAALPAGEPYALNAAGSSWLAPLAFSAEAPSALENVSLSGSPLASRPPLTNADAELGWKPGSSRDVVYITLTGQDPADSVSCSFRDDAGRGTVPAALLPRSSEVALSVHRLRSVALASTPGGAIDAGELRFDFELATTVARQGF